MNELQATLKQSAEDVGAAVVILCDLSGSMHGKRIERLREALQGLWSSIPRCRLLGFNFRVWAIESPDKLPECQGNTALHLALDAALVLRPAKVIVISDGHPDDEGAALNVAGKIPGIIDICFVGDDGDKRAIDFMYKLARVGGGRVVIRDIAKTRELLGPVLKDMLSLPAPIAL